ncbi:MAG: FAD-dependent oxidoreductase [Schaedlerella sp.]|nr:FAD-dependent oxidoreductase [Schaedlerella sp.]
MADYDIIVAGAGPAGLTSAIYSARAGKKVLVIEKMNPGGQIVYAPLVENYPGIPGMSGADFAEALVEQTLSFGVEFAYEEVFSVTPGNPIIVQTDLEERTCDALILAIGTEHRKLGLDKEEDLIGAGISYCAVCDGAFYSGKEVVVVGGGNTALQDAVFLSDICSRVTLVNRREQLRGDKVLVQKIEQRQNIEFLYPYTVKDLEETDGAVSGLVLEHSETGEEKVVKADGVFVAIGLKACSEPFENLGIFEEHGYILSDTEKRTSVEGIFAAGDCCDKKVRQLTTACGDGASAAVAACEYLDDLAV